MANPSVEKQAVLRKKTATACHWLLALPLAVALVLEVASLVHPLAFSVQLDAAFILLAAASTLAAQWRQLPLQNVLLGAAGIAVIGGGLSAVGARTGMPFGPFLFASGIGPLFYKALPWAMPLIWIVIVLNCRGVARLILRPWRKNKSYGYRVIALAAGLVLLFDFVLEPYAVRVKDYWRWLPTKLPLTWESASMISFFAWGLIAALILLFVTPVLIVKKPKPRSGPDFYPFCLWFGAILLCGIGCAVNRIWPPVIADAVIGTITAVFAIRGAMW